MDALVLAWLIVLSQIHSVLCDENLLGSKIDTPIEISHQSESQDPKHVNKELNKNAKSHGKTTEQKSHLETPVKPRIYPKNEVGDPGPIDSILKDITNIAHKRNNTNEIQKIRNLVDEIAENDEMQHYVEANLNNFRKKGVKTPKVNAKTFTTYIDPITEIETKERIDTVKKPSQPFKKDQVVTKSMKKSLTPVQLNKPELKIDTVKEPFVDDNGKNTDTTCITVKSLMVNNKRPNADLNDLGAAKTRTTLKDDNLVQVKEREYEEESTRDPNVQKNEYWYYRPNHNWEYAERNTLTENGKPFENYDINGNDYPLSSHTDYNNRYYSSNAKSYLSYQDNTIYRKCTLDRDTVISLYPNEQYVKSFNEERNEITNIQSPDFYRQYYSVTQKQYFDGR